MVAVLSQASVSRVEDCIVTAFAKRLSEDLDQECRWDIL